MFERFSEHGRQVVVLAQDEARSLGHERIGSEHVLLGLLREDDGLVELLGEPEEVRARVVELTGLGESSEGQMPFTEHARTIFTTAGEGERVGPIQLALALLDLPAGATALRALRLHGISVDEARDALLDPAGLEDTPAAAMLGLDRVALRVLDTASRHADDGHPGPEHLLLGLVLEAPALTGHALGVDDGGVVHERLLGLLEGPLPGMLAPRRDIEVIEAALRSAAHEERDVTPVDLLLGLIEVAPDVVARAAIDLEVVAARARSAR